MKSPKYTDVVVVGSGSAGVAAAVAAAGAGLKVVLIEKNPFPGGSATAAEVGTIAGLYKFSSNKTPEYIVGRFARNFAENIKKRSGTEPLYSAPGLHYLPYQIEEFKKICEDLLTENNVSSFTGAALQHIDMGDNIIESVSIHAKGESMTFRLGSIIDCSGDGFVSQLAGLPMIESEQYQAAAQTFSLQNIGSTNEATLGMVLMKELRLAVMEKKLAGYFERVYIVPGSLKNNCVSLKIGIPIAVTHTPGNLAELKTAGHEFVHELTDYLIKEVSLFKKASLLHIAPEPGIRVGRRTMGKYVLEEEDVLQCKKFDDYIANGSWPIEEWGQDRRVHMRYFQEDDFYQVPARCLQSNSIHNLFTGGRCISATDAAIASARVMGVCLQTGWAAGCLAAAPALNLSQEEAIRLIQEREFS